MEIKLTNGGIALIDDLDYELVSKHKWYRSYNGYAISHNLIKMHRLILSAKNGEIVDHINGDTLNNTRSNLRVVTRCENIHNQKKRSGTKNNYKGVNFVNSLGLYQSRCRMCHNDYYLGLFKSEVAAAYAYNKKAQELSSTILLNKLDYSIEELEQMLLTDRVTQPKAENKSVKGLYWHKRKNKWELRLRKNGIIYYGGSYQNEANAIEALYKLKKQLDGF